MNKTFQLMLALLIAALLMCFVLWIVMAISALRITGGCLYRYNVAEDGSIASMQDAVFETIILKANGNYTASASSNGSVTLSDDPSDYGKWLNTNVLVKGDQEIEVTVTGEVSLCRSYVPRFNPLSNNNVDNNGDPIPIPKLDDTDGNGSIVAPMSYIVDAKSNEWKTIAEVFPGDKIAVSLSMDRKGETFATQYNAITGTVINADCSDGQTTYSPICGRYSSYAAGNYVSTCDWLVECYECNCSGGSCEWCGCYAPVEGNMPEPYLSDGTHTYPRQENLGDYFIDFNLDCQTNHPFIMGSTYQDSKHFWLSADTGAGLLYRYDSSENPSAPTSLGSNYSQAEISGSNIYPSSSPYKVFLNEEYGDSTIKYLQVRLADIDGDYSTNTGGYVVNIKQTKCRSVNGNAGNDSYSGRGLIEYVILAPGKDANSSGSLSVSTIDVDSSGRATLSAPSDKDGNIWLRVKNRQEDYIHSTGQYGVELSSYISNGGFISDVLNPILQEFKSKTKSASEQIFKNMTCYQGASGLDTSCTNFFNYLRSVLILYIMVYGMMFLAGSVQITQMDIVIRVVKVGLVAGLMNERTFEFFSNNVFDFVTSFSDEMIANIGGYSLFTSGGSTISNPLLFLDNVMTKVFLSTTFKAQVTALPAIGLNGILYFIIIFITLIIMVIACLRAVAVYIMAFVAIAILMGIAPLFLSFILFSFTQGLFENWVKFTFRYMIEPVIVLSGLIILVQLFTIYLDIVIGYSVCWKCALSIKIPFIGAITAGLTPAFLDMPLFCLNWFAPWGHDTNTGPMGLNLAHIAALLILAYCMWGYIEFAGKLASRIAGSSGGPSATRMGTDMTDTMGNNALKPVGLDRKSRNRMKRQNKKRINRMIKDRDLGKTESFSSGVERYDRGKINNISAGTGLGKGKIADKAKTPSKK